MGAITSFSMINRQIFEKEMDNIENVSPLIRDLGVFAYAGWLHRVTSVLVNTYPIDSLGE